MRRKIMFIRIFLVILVLIPTTIMLSNPLRWSEERIRKYMLKYTPINTEMEDVISTIESNVKWEISWIESDHGVGVDKNGTPGEAGSTFIGEKSMRVHVGEYRTIFATDVLVFYAFDEDSKLIDIVVRKDIDSL